MSFHRYDFSEFYSNASGSIQFIELRADFNNESFWSGATITSARGSQLHSYTFPSNLPSTATANTTVLLATQGFAELGLVTPDFIVPDGFLVVAGGTVNFGSGADVRTHGALPLDGVSSLQRSGSSAPATPQNFAGTSASLPALTPISGTSADNVLVGTSGDELIEGLAGRDTLRSGGGNDMLMAGSGDDVVYSGAGNDFLDGGDGYDYLYYTEATAGVSIDLRSGQATGGAGSDTIQRFELVFGSAFDDTYVGGNQSIGFLGLQGNDTMTGGTGRDHLEGNEGDDVIDGGEGVDTTAFYSAAFAIDVDLGAGRATGGLGNDRLISIENAVGSVFDDRLAGSAVDNQLDGSDGNDTLVSSAGNDTLDGGIGLDLAVYAAARSTHTLHRSVAGEFTIEKPDAAGTDRLPSIERLQFSDTRLALDLDGAAGQTARLLGAVFGTGSLGDEGIVGIGLYALDSGMPYEELAALAVGATGASTPADVVTLLWRNLAGVEPTTEQAAPIVALLDGGMSVGALTVLAAGLDLNAANIDLVGLANSGIEYQLFQP